MANHRNPPVRPRGEGKLIRQTVLEKGSALIQETDPLKGFDLYVVGFHAAKDDPSMQMEAHHFCKQVNGEFLQCVLFDGNSEDANLIGVEYIISERLFDGLPEEEREFWHPHNFEILSGALVAPGLPDWAEKEMMRLLMNSYGKTWHTWHTGRHDAEPGDTLPLGEAMLMWSFNRDGEMDPALERSRDVAFGISTEEKRQNRRDLARNANPQHGVNAMRDAFPDASPTPPPGVIDKTDAEPGAPRAA